MSTAPSCQRERWDTAGTRGRCSRVGPSRCAASCCEHGLCEGSGAGQQKGGPSCCLQLVGEAGDGGAALPCAQPALKAVSCSFVLIMCG